MHQFKAAALKNCTRAGISTELKHMTGDLSVQQSYMNCGLQSPHLRQRQLVLPPNLSLGSTLQSSLGST